MMSEKITPDHLQRTACVYVRQSSPQQVRQHKEGQRRQYGLAGRAKGLGFNRVTVIDEDLGRSGSGTQERPGFARLLSSVCQGLVGAVFALEASRLARNNRDWHHLIDLCAITETLIIDADGVYDPRQLDDRLLLGLKGSMAEFELGLLRQRARQSYEQKVRRGCAMWDVPVGFVRTEEQQIEKTPDRQVQQAIEGVFKKFRELGSARQTNIWYQQERIPLPQTKTGTAGRETVWRIPGRGRVIQILKNPCYAGAFAYGRTTVKTIVQNGRAKKSGRSKQPLEDWKVLLPEHHSGYITWNEYLENQRILENNRNMPEGATRGAAKQGQALLSGLLRCGRCGRTMVTKYGGVGGNVPRYVCADKGSQKGSVFCMTVGGLRLDQAVSKAVLEAVQPLGVEAAIEAAESLNAEKDEKLRSMELALEKARYEAGRARRQYDAVDPENRLVAGELESRWNEALASVDELETRVNEMREASPPLSQVEKERLLSLGADLDQLWRHPAATVEIKKRILRTVLNEIVIDSQDDPPRHKLQLHWQGGVHTALTVLRNQRGKHGHATDRQALELIEELSKVCDDRAIASVLNRLGIRTGQGNSWRAARVAQARYYYRLPNYEARSEWLTLQQAAGEMQVSNTVMLRLVKEGALPASQVVKYAPWIIKRKDLDLPAVQNAVKAVRQGKRCPPTILGQQELPFE